MQRRQPRHQDDLAAGAREIIDANRYMTLATADDDGCPWAAPVWYAHLDYTDFFWVSRPDARHSRNLASRPELAIVIFDSTVPKGEAQAVYVEALAEELGRARARDRDHLAPVRSPGRRPVERRRRDRTGAASPLLRQGITALHPRCPRPTGSGPARLTFWIGDPNSVSRPQAGKGDTVSATVLYMSMSLDGFIAGPNEGPDNPLGDGGHRLHEWWLTGADADDKGVGRPAGVNGEIFDESMATGAIVAGRGTFEPAGGWGGDHHDGVPIFVLSRQEPGIEIGQWPLVTYLPDVRTAMTQAKEAAGDKNVLVHGAATAQLALAAGVLDELEIHLVPVLLGQGRRLFDERGPEHIELERTRILEGEAGVTHMHYRVQR